MFVRFRERNGRLLISLAETRRLDGKVRQEHVADLGAVELAPSIEARVVFWKQLYERWHRISNRIGTEKLGTILGAINARVPMVAVEEYPAARRAKAERGVESWGRHVESCQEQLALYQELKEKIEADMERWSAEAVRAQSNLDAAKAALDDPNAALPPELTYQEAYRIMRAMGWTNQRIYRARKLARMSEEEFERFVKRRPGRKPRD
jgi:hypothetical protein